MSLPNLGKPAGLHFLIHIPAAPYSLLLNRPLENGRFITWGLQLHRYLIHNFQRIIRIKTFMVVCWTRVCSLAGAAQTFTAENWQNNFAGIVFISYHAIINATVAS